MPSTTTPAPSLAANLAALVSATAVARADAHRDTLRPACPVWAVWSVA